MERKLIEHCSPTLAGIKCGSMFKYTDTKNTGEEIERLNRLLNPRGISIMVIFSCPRRDLILVYREEGIKERLTIPGVREFMSLKGYDCHDVQSCLTDLKKKMSTECVIPPEIGIFLGYPLDDVIGFMENDGRFFKTIGCWKVYSNEESAVKTFSKYKKCKDIFIKKYDSGSSIIKLAVTI